MTLPSVKGRTSCGETNLWNVSSSLGNYKNKDKLILKTAFAGSYLLTALCKCVIVRVRCVRYLRRELEHGSAHNERSRVMLCSQSQCMCAIKRPQTPVSQNRLCADDDLNNTHTRGNKWFNYLKETKACVWLTWNKIIMF